MIKGDQDFKRDCLLLNNVHSNKPCSNCPADVTGCMWFDFSKKAKWMTQIYTSAKWRTLGLDKCPLYKIRGVSNHSTDVALSG